MVKQAYYCSISDCLVSCMKWIKNMLLTQQDIHPFQSHLPISSAAPSIRTSWHPIEAWIGSTVGYLCQGEAVSPGKTHVEDLKSSEVWTVFYPLFHCPKPSSWRVTWILGKTDNSFQVQATSPWGFTSPGADATWAFGLHSSNDVICPGPWEMLEIQVHGRCLPFQVEVVKQTCGQALNSFVFRNAHVFHSGEYG